MRLAEGRELEKPEGFRYVPLPAQEFWDDIRALNRRRHATARQHSSSQKTSPVSPFTVTSVPDASRENSSGRRSIMGMPAMIAPIATIGSASALMIAAGAFPFCFSA